MPDSCFVTSKLGQFRFMTYAGDRKCLTFDPSRTISGIWINEFEGSSFHENMKRLNDVQSGKYDVWLSIDNDTAMSPELERRGFGRAYKITFIGRNARDMLGKSSGGYGHGSLYKDLVIVDRVIDLEDVGHAAPRRR